MNRHITRLSEHLRCAAFCKLPQMQAVECQERVLSKFGTVSVKTFATPSQAIEFLLPLKTFVRRYLIWQCGEWCFVCSDMIGEWRMVDVYAHSRMTRCTAVASVALPDTREFCYITDGVIQRQIGCFEDGDRWLFQSGGDPLPFEDVARYCRRIKRERLTPEMAEALLGQVVGRATPFGGLCSNTLVVGLERSWKDIRRPVEEFCVENDVLNSITD
jgi:hypothetical protein